MNANVVMKVLTPMTSPKVRKMQVRLKVVSRKMEGAGWQGSEEVPDFSPGLMNTLPVAGLPITG